MYQGNRTIQSLKRFIGSIKDPLDNRGKKYDIHESIILVIIGFICGKSDYTNMAHYLKLREKQLKQFMELKNGVPSHDTLNRHIAMIDEDELTYALCGWSMEMIGNPEKRHYIMDGKALRASTNKTKDEKIPYVLNLIDQVTKILLFQKGIGEKENEISSIPKILDVIGMKDSVITIDAIGTQYRIMDRIDKAGGYYILSVKDNQPKLNEDIQLYLDYMMENEKENVRMMEEKEKNHGRYEKRRYILVECPEETVDPRFKTIKMAGKVIREREIIKYRGKEQKSLQEVIYVTNKSDIKIEEFAGYIRNHWTIENSLHWVLDDSFREDRSTVKKGKVNSSLIRKSAYNIVRLHQQTMEDRSVEYIMDELRSNMQQLFKYINDELILE